MNLLNAYYWWLYFTTKKLLRLTKQYAKAKNQLIQTLIFCILNKVPRETNRKKKQNGQITVIETWNH